MFRPRTCYHFSSGLTLIELLVVISIIGLLSTLAVVAIGDSRTKSRDAKRLADLKQVQNAMDLFADKYTASGYAVGCASGVSGTTSVALSAAVCNVASSSGLADFMNTSTLKDPSSTGTACAATATLGCDYAFTTTAPTSSAYTIGFYLEKGTTAVPAGAHKLTQTGIQ